MNTKRREVSGDEMRGESPWSDRTTKVKIESVLCESIGTHAHTRKEERKSKCDT